MNQPEVENFKNALSALVGESTNHGLEVKADESTKGLRIFKMPSLSSNLSINFSCSLTILSAHSLSQSLPVLVLFTSFAVSIAGILKFFLPARSLTSLSIFLWSDNIMWASDFSSLSVPRLIPAFNHAISFALLFITSVMKFSSLFSAILVFIVSTTAFIFSPTVELVSDLFFSLVVLLLQAVKKHAP